MTIPMLLAVLGAPPAIAGAAPGTLGRFTDYLVPVITVFLIVAAVLSHLGVVGAPDVFIDGAALLALGQVFGRAQGVVAGQTQAAAALADQVNLNTQQLVKRADLNTDLAEAAHRRLDAIAAPPANLDHTGIQIGNPDTHEGGN